MRPEGSGLSAVIESGWAHVGFGLVMAVMTTGVAMVRHLTLGQAILLGLVIGGISGVVPFAVTRRQWGQRAVSRVFLLCFLGCALLTGFLWIERGVSSGLTVIALATTVVYLVGVVVAMKSRWVGGSTDGK